jgi:hypothetical protein
MMLRLLMGAASHWALVVPATQDCWLSSMAGLDALHVPAAMRAALQL